jgi:hypothetical protein
VLGGHKFAKKNIPLPRPFKLHKWIILMPCPLVCLKIDTQVNTGKNMSEII